MKEQFDECLASQGIVHYYQSDWYTDRLRFFSAGAKTDQQSVIEAITDLKRTDEQLALSPDGWNEALDALKKQLEASNG